MEDIHPIKAVIETPILSQGLVRALWSLLFIFILLLIVIISYYFWKKRQKSSNNHDRETKVKIDYQKLAKDKLFKAKDLIKQTKYKEFQLKVSKIIKEYLSSVFQENISEQTTREILSNKDFSTKLISNLERLLTVADYEKFANLDKKAEEAEKVFQIALEIIEIK